MILWLVVMSLYCQYVLEYVEQGPRSAWPSANPVKSAAIHNLLTDFSMREETHSFPSGNG